MKVGKTQIFNLMDTNGRRNDVVNALSGYIEILNSISKEVGTRWTNMPESPIQYEFYKQAIELSPEIFKQHVPYDKLKVLIESFPEFRKALERHDVAWITSHQSEHMQLISSFDKGIEDRARHYTSNLVKLGFTDDNREISPVGKYLLDLDKLSTDELEATLPIDKVNIIYLRQLMKLRIFDNDGENYYSPFNMAIFILLKKGRFSEKAFFELVQGLNPYYDFSSVDKLIDEYQEGDIVNGENITLPAELLSKGKFSEGSFRKNFKNQKSRSAVNVYWTFYNLTYNFHENTTSQNLDDLLTYYEYNKDMLDKAFGQGKALFSNRRGVRPEVKEFLKKHKKIFDGDLNENLYSAFIFSKQLDTIREYSDTTKRIFKATGIIRFDNGFVELAYKELCECIFKPELISKRVYGRMAEELNPYYKIYDEYEGDVYTYFCEDYTLCQICGYYDEDIKEIKSNIQKMFGGTSIAEIPKIVADKRKAEFVAHIAKNYPISTVKEILGMFNDRRNDKAIKDRVSPDASVPTIYEYIVGIAWYYFSGKRIDLLSSFNLTLSANFEPLIHAGGGQGDIVIYENDKVVMLEATLMNANSQKRGEWEPVLRHSVNLKIKEEAENTGRDVTSFFIADEFDNNTINIWKAIAAVPMESSIQKGKFTDNVVIMPINSNELAAVMEKSEQYDEIIKKVRKLFEVEKVTFDLEWRSKFISAINRVGGSD